MELSVGFDESHTDNQVASDPFLVAIRNCRTDLDECAHRLGLDRIPSILGGPDCRLRVSICAEGQILKGVDSAGPCKPSYISEYLFGRIDDY
jgi:hypothetical protein